MKAIDSYIISLKNPVDLINELPGRGLNPILFKGVDGKRVSSKIKKRHLSNEFALNGTPASQGIALSHLSAWKKISKSNNEYCIVLEDDAKFYPYYSIETLETMINDTPSDFDILYLGTVIDSESDYPLTYNITGTISSMLNINNKNNKNINNNIKIPKFSYGAHAYLLSKKGAKKLIELSDGIIDFHIDLHLSCLQAANKINAYSVRKRLVYQTSGINTSISTNIGSTSPVLISNILTLLKIEDYLSLSYVLNVSIYNIGKIHLSGLSCIIFLTGMITSLIFNIDHVLLTYILISIPELIHNHLYFIINAILLSFPFFITTFI